MRKKTFRNLTLLTLVLLTVGCGNLEERRTARELKKFNSVVEKKSLIELENYRTSNPDSVHLEKIDGEIALLYSEAKKYSEDSKNKNLEFYSFAKELIDYMEKNGNEIDVIFYPMSKETLEAWDKIVAVLIEDEYKEFLLPFAPSFTDEVMKKYEGRVSGHLETVLNLLVPHDLIRVKNAGRGDRESDETTILRPVIEIDYDISPSADLYSLEDSDDIFIGIGLSYEIKMSLPDSDTIYELELEVDPPEEYKVNSSKDDGVYLQMADESFEEFPVKFYEIVLDTEADLSTRIKITLKSLDTYLDNN